VQSTAQRELRNASAAILRRAEADILVAATAHAHGVAVYTRNLDDFEPFGQSVDVFQA
jgi:predicted nucleic acid-binding protein